MGWLGMYVFYLYFFLNDDCLIFIFFKLLVSVKFVGLFCNDIVGLLGDIFDVYCM